VMRDEEGPSLRFELEDRESGPYRALWEDREEPTMGVRTRVLVIQGRHRALRRYLEEAPDFPGQNQPWTRLVIAEIIADNVCREIARRVDALRSEEDRPDSEGFYAEHYGRMHRILPRLQQLMLPTTPPPSVT
ncbi:MAG: hypothetical protein ACE5JL_09800, partial [Dehalococcoidia bacterium]